MSLYRQNRSVAIPVAPIYQPHNTATSTAATGVAIPIAPIYQPHNTATSTVVTVPRRSLSNKVKTVQKRVKKVQKKKTVRAKPHKPVKKRVVRRHKKEVR